MSCVNLSSKASYIGRYLHLYLDTDATLAMLIWIFAATCAGLLIMTGRSWMEFTQRADQLNREIGELE